MGANIINLRSDIGLLKIRWHNIIGKSMKFISIDTKDYYIC